MLTNTLDEKSTLVQIMAWCRQANVDPVVSRPVVSPGHNVLTLEFERYTKRDFPNTAYFLMQCSRVPLYNAVQFGTILHVTLLWQWQNVNKILISQQPPHTSPWWASYGVSIVRIWEKIDRLVTAQHYIYTTATGERL